MDRTDPYNNSIKSKVEPQDVLNPRHLAEVLKNNLLEEPEASLNSKPLAEVQKKNLKLKGGRQCPEMANIFSDEAKLGPKVANTEESATIKTWHEGSNTGEGLDSVNTEVGQTCGYIC